MAWGAGAIWVGNGEDGTISRIDPATNIVVATIEMHANQWTLDQALNTCCPNLSLAGDDQQIWAGVHRGTPATITDTVEQIDPTTNQVVRTIDLPAKPEFMLLDGDTLWITAGHSDQAMRVDIPSGTVVATFEIKTAGAMAVADGAAWISGGFPDGSGGALYRIDPQTNTIAATIDLPLGGWPFTLNDELWLVEYYGNGIHRIDTATNTIAESTHVSGVLGGFPGAGSIWVNMLKNADFPGMVARIDPETMQITARYDAGGFAGGMLFAEGAVWITELKDHLVERIDP
jgi:streptogramin lyase